MKAVTWQGKRSVEVTEVPDPRIEQTTDAVIKVTSTNICGSDLHLYEVLGAFMAPGDVLGHEAMGIVEAVGPEVSNLAPGDRVVIPFQISCGHCWMCTRDLPTQCETTQVREMESGAALFGYSKLYGQVAGGQAEYLRVPQAQHTHIKVPHGPPDDRYVYLSDVLPTALQAVQYAAVPPGGSLVVLGLGPIGDMACRIAAQQGVEQVIGVDLVPERLDRARARGIDVVDVTAVDDLTAFIRDRTEGRGADAVIDAVGTEAHGATATKLVQSMVSRLPGKIAEPLMQSAALDRMAALHTAIDAVRRGGTISVIGVYGGMADPLPMRIMFDKQIQMRMGQANVMPRAPQLLELLGDDDPLGVDEFATHRIPLLEAAHGYDIFQRKADGAVKVMLKP